MGYLLLILHSKTSQEMKKKRIVMMVVLVAWTLCACGPKPYYKTSEGKKKQKYYNDIQYGGKSASQMKKP